MYVTLLTKETFKGIFYMQVYDFICIVLMLY